jgi:hypothetical protein
MYNLPPWLCMKQKFIMMPIPAGYARVGVEEVCEGYETLELNILGDDGEKTQAEAIHGYILWLKRNIILKSTDQA